MTATPSGMAVIAGCSFPINFFAFSGNLCQASSPFKQYTNTQLYYITHITKIPVFFSVFTCLYLLVQSFNSLYVNIKLPKAIALTGRQLDTDLRIKRIINTPAQLGKSRLAAFFLALSQ